MIERMHRDANFMTTFAAESFPMSVKRMVWRSGRSHDGCVSSRPAWNYRATFVSFADSGVMKLNLLHSANRGTAAS